MKVEGGKLGEEWKFGEYEAFWRDPDEEERDAGAEGDGGANCAIQRFRDPTHVSGPNTRLRSVECCAI